MTFAQDLKPSFVSDFRANEYDRILEDIQDVADRQALDDLRKGKLTVMTVSDYLDHMVRCYRRNPTEVVRILSLSGTQEKPWWNRLLRRLGFGRGE